MEQRQKLGISGLMVAPKQHFVHFRKANVHNGDYNSK